MTTITKLALALSIAFSSVAYAAEDNNESKSNMTAKPIVLFGYAFGGDDMGELEYDDGSSSSVSAGGGLTMGGGVDVMFDSASIGLPKPVGVQLTAAYKFDSATAENADITMDRFEFTVLPYIQLNEKVSLGIGVAFHTGVEFSIEMDGSGSDTIEFDTATALVGELAFTHSEQLKWGFRFSSVDYEISAVNGRDFSGYDTDAVGGGNFGGFVVYSFDQ